MYIKNGQNIKNIKYDDNITVRKSDKEESQTENVKELSNISDITEIKPSESEMEPSDISYKYTGLNYSSGRLKKHRKPKKNAENINKKDRELKTNRFTKYLYERKYFILLYSVIYVVGLIIGAILIKNIETGEFIFLRSAVDNYFAGVSSVNMVPRIINNIAVNSFLLFFVYLSGITVFAPLICTVVCLYKGLSFGYIIGIYISGGAGLFHFRIFALTFIFYLLTMLCFILSCSESTGYSVFLLKSGESYRNALSFSNMSVYSVRYILLLLLMSLLTALQIIIISLAYSFY